MLTLSDKYSSEKFQRRALLKGIASLPLVAVMPSVARSQNIYSRHKGQTLRISIPTHPHYDAMRDLLPVFSSETGIRVDVDQRPIPEMKNLQLSEMKKDNCDFDLISYVAMWKGEYVKKGLIKPISPYFENSRLSIANYDIKDIISVYFENIGLVGGWKGYLAGGAAKLYGLPYGAETSILAYRKDIFDSLKLAPPNTYFELEKILPILRDKAALGALTTRGMIGHQCVHAWLLHLNPIGGKIFENNWTPRFNDTAGVRALSLLKQIIDTGPAGALEFDQGAMMQSFLDGRSVMYLDSTIIFGAVRDSKRSKIDGKVAYARHPKGSMHSAQSGGLGLAIPAKARHPDAAFLLLQWLTSKEQDKVIALRGGTPHRYSTLSDASLLAKFPEYAVLQRTINDADPNWRPIIPPWDEINSEVLGPNVHGAIAGTIAPKPALDKAVQLVTQIMQREGYLSRKI